MLIVKFFEYIKNVHMTMEVYFSSMHLINDIIPLFSALNFKVVQIDIQDFSPFQNKEKQSKLLFKKKSQGYINGLSRWCNSLNGSFFSLRDLFFFFLNRKILG